MGVRRTCFLTHCHASWSCVSEMVSTCKAGDHIVASSAVFGGTAGLLNNVLPNLGITASIVDNNPEAARAAMH